MGRLLAYGFLTAGLVMSGTFFPALGFIGLILSPLPLAYLGCTEGRKSASIAEITAEAVLLFFVSPYMALYFFLGCAPVSATICILKDVQIIKNTKASENLLICFTVSIISKVILMVVFWLLTGHNAMFPDLPQLEIILARIYKDQPSLLSTLQAVLYIFPSMIPLFVILYSGIESYINYVFCERLTRNKNFLPGVAKFKDWRFPNSILFALVFATTMGYATDMKVWREGVMFAMNLEILISIFLFLQGLSFLIWLVERFRFNVLGKILICILISFPLMWLLIVILGICDIMINIRERLRAK